MAELSLGPRLPNSWIRSLHCSRKKNTQRRAKWLHVPWRLKRALPHWVQDLTLWPLQSSLGVCCKDWNASKKTQELYNMFLLCFIHSTSSVYGSIPISQVYSTGNSTWCTVVTWMGRKAKRERGYVYVWLIHFAEHWKLTQHHKATILQKKCIKRKRQWQKMIQNVSTGCHGLITTIHWELIYFYLTLANKRMNISLSCSRQNRIDLN